MGLLDVREDVITNLFLFRLSFRILLLLPYGQKVGHNRRVVKFANFTLFEWLVQIGGREDIILVGALAFMLMLYRFIYRMNLERLHGEVSLIVKAENRTFLV